MPGFKPRIHFKQDQVISYIESCAEQARWLHSEVRCQTAVFIESPGESPYTEDIYRSGFRFGCKQERIVTIMAEHILCILFNLTEAANGLLEMNQEGYSKVTDAFSDDFTSWRNMRHDACHRFDRIFRERNKQRNYNDSFVNGCRGYWAAHYSVGRGLFVTGRSPESRLCLEQAVGRAAKFRCLITAIEVNR